ncbi:MAG TPA: hypothetical protein VIY47_00190 [Ignavibacteriaceae bacterium]
MSVLSQLERFHQAIEFGSISDVHEFLDASNRVELLTKPLEGQFPLHRASLSCNPEMILYLGMEGCDPRQKTVNRGLTPLLCWAERMWKIRMNPSEYNKADNFHSHGHKMLLSFYQIGSWIHEQDYDGKNIKEIYPSFPDEWAEYWIQLGGWEWCYMSSLEVSPTLDIGPALLYKEHLEELEIPPDEMEIEMRKWGEFGLKMSLNKSKKVKAPWQVEADEIPL